MAFDKVGVMLDCSRNAVPSVKALKKFIDLMKEMGYNMLMLYTEDTYEVENQPYFGYLRGRYSVQEMKEIDDYCFERGIECIPCIQTLAHLNAFMKWGCTREYNDCGDILLVGEEKTYKLIEDMFRTLSKTFRSKNIHIGMDEAFALGRGKYLDKNGYSPSIEIIRPHLKKVQEIADKYGYTSLIWSDMLFRTFNNGNYYTENPDIITEKAMDAVPENVTPVYWDYYSLDKKHYDNMMKAHKNLNKPVWFAGGLWKWTGFVPANKFSIEANKQALASCRENDVENVVFTMWGDNGAEASLYSVLPAMFHASQLIKGIEDEEEIKKNFKVLTGIDFDTYMYVDIPEVADLSVKKGCVAAPAKYMLYNDYFCGINDFRKECSEEAYADTAEKLLGAAENENFGYVFKTIGELCDILAIKHDIGIRTRNAYRMNDTEEIKLLINDYNSIIEKLEHFYSAFKAQWFEENKPYGFEIQDARIGGLIRRTMACRDRLTDFANGKITQIPELDEDILIPKQGEDFMFGTWGSSFVSVM